MTATVGGPATGATTALGAGIVVPLVLVPLTVVAIWIVYRRSVAALAPDGHEPAVNAARLTAEHLHRLRPPWRVVHEIHGALGVVDHVVVGPPGAIAVVTRLGDLTTVSNTAQDPHAIAAHAIARGAVDDVLGGGLRCHLLVLVHWGVSGAGGVVDLGHGAVAVHGRELVDWLATLPAVGIAAPDVDSLWRNVVRGIGRPDPLGHAGDPVA